MAIKHWSFVNNNRFKDGRFSLSIFCARRLRSARAQRLGPNESGLVCCAGGGEGEGIEARSRVRRPAASFDLAGVAGSDRWLWRPRAERFLLPHLPTTTDTRSSMWSLLVFITLQINIISRWNVNESTNVFFIIICNNSMYRCMRSFARSAPLFYLRQIISYSYWDDVPHFSLALHIFFTRKCYPRL